MEISKWTKRLDDMHYYKTRNSQISKTLCGKIMLGNNYAKDNPDRELCLECKEKVKGLEK